VIKKTFQFDAVVIGKVFTNEIIFKVSTKAIEKSYRHIAMMSKSTSCLSLNSDFSDGNSEEI
jgi:hypothetical protein